MDYSIQEIRHGRVKTWLHDFRNVLHQSNVCEIQEINLFRKTNIMHFNFRSYNRLFHWKKETLKLSGKIRWNYAAKETKPAKKDPQKYNDKLFQTK